MKTLVMGATDNPSRYAYLAVRNLLRYGHEVVAIGRKEKDVLGVTIHHGPVDIKDVNTVTLYLNPRNQEEWLDYIIGLKPKRIIFNPGTENPELIKRARENGI